MTGSAVPFGGLRLGLVAAALALAAAAGEARPRPVLLKNPALLNIGFVCQWQARCMKRQEQAMGRALKHVRKYRPPAWKVQLCNRNAARGRTRVDWIGFDNCIRNPALQPPRRTAKRRR